jgi:hypothetical protein
VKKDNLDPVRWSHRRRSRLVRAAAVAALLAVAAGILFTGVRPATATRCTTAPSPTAPSSTAPSPTGSASGAGIPPGKLGVPVRVDQPGLSGLLHRGDHVTLTVASDSASRADILVPDALVLRAPSGDSSVASSGSVVYLAMTEEEARRTTAITPDARIGITVRPG